MTILIKGMKMPENGDELLSIDIWPSGKVSINSDPMCKEVGTAVEIPTPHGRLIDADDLQELYANTDDLDISDYYVNIVVVRQNIKDMPTIIEAEEVQE